MNAGHNTFGVIERLPVSPVGLPEVSNTEPQAVAATPLESIVLPEANDQKQKWHPEQHSFQKIPWFIFGTVTWARFSRRMPSERARQERYEDCNWLLMQTIRRLNRRQKLIKTLAVVSTTEFHLSGEVHLHFLMRDSGLEGVQAKAVADLMTSLWTSELRAFDSTKSGIGKAVIAPYDYQTFAQAGANYICKVQTDSKGRPLEKEFHYSPGFWKALELQDPRTLLVF
jgi:hypothetical protein